jgi:hypothetical protein
LLNDTIYNMQMGAAVDHYLRAEVGAVRDRCRWP